MSETAIKSARQQAAEARVSTFQKRLGAFVVAAETTRMAMVFTDAQERDNPIIFCKRRFS